MFYTHLNERQVDVVRYIGKRELRFFDKKVAGILPGMLLFLLAACGPAINSPPTQAKVTIDRSFQSQMTPPPTVPTYRCGAWSSNNTPGAYSTISIYAKLTQDIMGMSGGVARAVAHLDGSNVALKQQPISDSNGYVTFSLPLRGRQPAGVPTTVDISFSIGGKTVQCTPAFFTPH